MTHRQFAKSKNELSIFSILHLLQEQSTNYEAEKAEEIEESAEERKERLEMEKEERAWKKEERDESRKEREKTKKEKERKEKNESLITLLFFFSIGFHLWDVVTRLNYAEIPPFHFNYAGYLVFAIIASIAYDEINLKSILRNLGLFTTMYFAPVLLQFISFNIGLPLQMASSLILLGLVFSIPFYFSILRGNHKTQLIGTIYLTILFLLMLGANFNYVEQMSAQFAPELGLDTPGIPMGMTLQYVFKDIIWDGLWGWIELGYNSVASLISGQIQSAIDPFQGKVESGAKEKIGVYLEQVKLMGAVREGDEIIVTGKLYAKSIDMPVDVEIDCIMDPNSVLPGSRKRASEIYPKLQYKQINDVEETIECSWICKKEEKDEEKCKKVDVGAHDVLMRARVSDFTTSAYLKGYFMNEETMRELRIKGIEPLESMKVQDKNPIAVYTKGPVEVGMELSSKPIISISSSEQTSFFLELSLRNLWGGKITEVSDIYLIVPKEIEIEGFTGIEDKIPMQTCDALPDEQKTGCNSQAESVYHLTQKELEGISFDETTNAVVYRAKMNIPNSEIQSFMGRQQFVQKYFKIITKYNFEVEKKTSFFVKK